VACEGGELKIHGKKHENLIRLVTVTFSITEVDVFEKKGKLRTADDGLLSRACNLAFKGCGMEEMTLVIDLTKINLCPYVRIRSAMFETIRQEQMTKEVTLINDEHKLMFSVGT
jgi:hypothetical protein